MALRKLGSRDRRTRDEDQRSRLIGPFLREPERDGLALALLT